MRNLLLNRCSLSQAGGNPERKAVFVEGRQPAVIVHNQHLLELVACFVSLRPFQRGRAAFFFGQSSFLWPLGNRGAEQGNRVRIPDGSRRCMRDVRCSSQNVSHWGRILRRQSMSAKAGSSCPKRKSEDLQKETLPGTGRRAWQLRAQKNGCGPHVHSPFFAEKGSVYGETQ